MCEHTFVPSFSFTVVERDPERLWIVVNVEHQTVTLDPDVNFFAWASQRWPAPRWSVSLAPQLPEWPRD